MSRSAGWAALAIALGMPLVVAPGAADSAALAYPLLGDRDPPTLLLAQRTIERSWGPSDDSVYVVLDVPGWRPEGVALGLSAAVPGAGQTFAGNRMRGLWFLLAEAAGWTARLIYRHRAEDLRNQATDYAGAPGDSASAWSFSRWSQATGDDPAELQALYRADRDVFYDLIANDPRYLDGWEGNPLETRSYFSRLRADAETRFGYARITSTALWLNHLVSAVDALRVARLHNLPLRPNLSLDVKGRWGWRGPEMSATLVRKF